ncbi:hypothetical protein SANTM175S_02509 [Streptomyces antimycoticus]
MSACGLIIHVLVVIWCLTRHSGPWMGSPVSETEVTTAPRPLLLPDGRPAARAWSLDPALLHLNHGSFGAVPLVAQERQNLLREEMDRSPVVWFPALPQRVANTRVDIAAFLRVAPGDLALVPNASAGVSTVYAALLGLSGDGRGLLQRLHGPSAPGRRSDRAPPEPRRREDQWARPAGGRSQRQGHQPLATAGWGIRGRTPEAGWCSSSPRARRGVPPRRQPGARPQVERSPTRSPRPALLVLYVTMTEHPEKYLDVSQPRGVAWWTEWEQKADADVQKMALGKMTPKELLADWDAYWTKKWEREK